MRLISRCGNADVYFTEYFRLLPESRLDPQILSSITQHPAGRPLIVQMIGNDIAVLVRTDPVPLLWYLALFGIRRARETCT